MNEIMTGSVDTRSVVSRMTLALLEDSGWYRANYSMAEHLDWGQNQGTEFVISPCNSWKGAYHCNTTQLSGCTYNREAEGYCPIVSYSGDLPKWAQYFPQANKGMPKCNVDYFVSGIKQDALFLALNRMLKFMETSKRFKLPFFQPSSYTPLSPF